MIQRYTRPEMANIWTEENKLNKWLDIEIAALEGWNKIGIIPTSALKNIKKNVRLDVEKIHNIEKKTGHDVIAFVEQISETAGKYGYYLHYGLTSSDILDTSLALQLRDAGNLLLKDIADFLKTLREKSLAYKDTVMMGRTHGIHAEPLTFGFKLAGWYFEFLRHSKRMTFAIQEINVGKLSGAVGTFSNVDPRVEEYVCKKFSLEREMFSTQIISRDRHAFFLSVVGMIAASCEKVALQIRLLQQSELSEVAEPFGRGQKGSSAMPHKRNPILSERICGLARIIKKNVSVAMDNIALWHERDISHSSAERIVFPDSTILLDYIITLLHRIIKDMDVFEKNMNKNIDANKKVFFSQMLLNTLVMKGVSRKYAYELVQKKSFESIYDNKDFFLLVKQDAEIQKYLTEEEIDDIFDINYLLRNLKSMFEKLQ